MALNIRNKEAETLAGEVARRTGETKTQAEITTLKERLARVKRLRPGRRLARASRRLRSDLTRFPYWMPATQTRFWATTMMGCLADLFRERAGLDVVEVDEQQAREARQAYSRLGKGRHPAGLNFGDCFSYALAVTSGDPLLFKGNDFEQTDVESVF